VLGQLWFYLTTVIPKTLTFWYIAHAGHPFDNTATIMIALLALGFSGVGIKALLSSKQVAVGEEKRKLALQALAIIVIIVPLSAAFPLVAVPGRFVPYRTLASHMAMGFILAFWGTRFIGLRLLQGYRHIAWAKLYAPLAVVTFALVCCSFMLERYIVRPMNFEQDYVQSKLSGLQASDTHINIALRQDPSRSSYLKEGSIDADGWGACITCFYWWGVPLVVSILQDHGFKISDPVYIPEENKLTWNHGQIVVLSSPQQEVPKGALIIDMHDLFTLSSGL
jgi:hypothetical protein